MATWQEELIEAWKNRQFELAQGCADLANKSPLVVTRYKPEDFMQLITAHLGMMVERLENKGTEMYDMYMETVIPSLLLQGGERVSVLIRSVTTFGFLFYKVLVPEITPENREQAGECLSFWFADHNADIVRVGMGLGAQP